MRFDAVIFDFDGTLADTSEGILESIGYALRRLGRAPLTDAQMRLFIGPPLLHSFQTVAGLDARTAEEAVELYRVNYEQNGGMFKLRFYDGLLPLLSELQTSGIRTGIASAKPDVFVQAILRRFDAGRLFDCARGISLEECCTDKSDVIRSVMQTLCVTQPQRALMVGDTLFDVDGALSVGATAAAALYGFGDEAQLRASGADVCVENADALRRYIYGETANG